MKASHINHCQANRTKQDNWAKINKALCYAEAQADILRMSGDHETAVDIVLYLTQARVALNDEMGGE